MHCPRALRGESKLFPVEERANLSDISEEALTKSELDSKAVYFQVLSSLGCTHREGPSDALISEEKK